jgi:two-component system, LytTR family, response regulator
MIVKSVLIEHDSNSLLLLETYLNEIPILTPLLTFCNIDKAQNFLNAHIVAFLFIDINLASSIAFLKLLTSKPIILFTSTYKQNIPGEFDRFQKSICRAMELSRLNAFAEHGEKHFLIVPSSSGKVKIPLDEIEFIQSCQGHLKIFSHGESPLVAFMGLKEVLIQIPNEKFRRVHKSFIVAVSKVKKIGNNKILMSSLREIPFNNNYTNLRPASIK